MFILNNKTVYENPLPYTGVQKTCPNVNSSYKITSWHNMKTAKDMLGFLKTLKDRPVTVAYHASDFSGMY